MPALVTLLVKHLNYDITNLA